MNATATIQAYSGGGWTNVSAPKTVPSFVSAAGTATAEGTATGLYTSPTSAGVNTWHRLKVCITVNGVSTGPCAVSALPWFVAGV